MEGLLVMAQHNVVLTSNAAASVQVTLSSKGPCLASWQSGLSISNVVLHAVCMHKYQVHLFRDFRVGLRPPGGTSSRSSVGLCFRQVAALLLEFGLVSLVIGCRNMPGVEKHPCRRC
jgi:hypothetical protein